MTTRKIETLMIPGPAGRLESLLEEPDGGEPRFAALVCHPHPQHGGTMHNKVVYRTARGLRKAGGVTLRFNYRGVNLSEGEYDHGKGETEDARSELAYLRDRYPNLPYLIAGFSFGSRIAHRLASDGPGPIVAVCLGMPVWYFEHEDIISCPTPRIFIQSTNDEFGPREPFQANYDKLDEPKSLIWIEAKDHFFAGALEQLEAAVASVPSERLGDSGNV
jgi:alpha/beta superfamily hydrolase